LLACMHADKARTTYCGIPSVDTLWDDCHVELSRRKRSNEGSISRTGARLRAIPIVYTTRTMVSALLPDLMRMQLLSRLLSYLFRSRTRRLALSRLYPTCFDQETKPFKKQNRYLFRSRNKTVQETKPCPALPRIFLEFFFQALPTRFCHRICDRVVQNAQPCHRQTPHSSFFSSGCPWPKATVKPLCEIQVPKLRSHILKITS
jgi:hypothetical protein